MSTLLGPTVFTNDDAKTYDKLAVAHTCEMACTECKVECYVCCPHCPGYTGDK